MGGGTQHRQRSQLHDALLHARLARLPELTRQEADPERALALVCRRLFGDSSAMLQLDRFELKRTLGQGGMGVVYEAIDPLRRERVALKMLHPSKHAQPHHLEREFRALAGLQHPNLVALHELCVNSSVAYYSMDLIRGRNFTSYTRNTNATQLDSALRQLCEGVHALHVAGKLHRDLKPENVLVTKTGRVVLLDFGLVDDLAAVSGSVAGTPAYMAPEQARGRACEDSDWYSVGMMLRLTLRARQARLHAASRALEQLAERLTRVEPRQRPRFEDIVAILDDTQAQLRAKPARGSGRCTQ